MKRKQKLKLKRKKAKRRVYAVPAAGGGGGGGGGAAAVGINLFPGGFYGYRPRGIPGGGDGNGPGGGFPPGGKPDDKKPDKKPDEPDKPDKPSGGDQPDDKPDPNQAEREKKRREAIAKLTEKIGTGVATAVGTGALIKYREPIKQLITSAVKKFTPTSGLRSTQRTTDTKREYDPVKEGNYYDPLYDNMPELDSGVDPEMPPLETF